MPYPLPKDPLAALRAGLRDEQFAHYFGGKTLHALYLEGATVHDIHVKVDAERVGLYETAPGVSWTVQSLAHLWGKPRGFGSDEIEEALK